MMAKLSPELQRRYTIDAAQSAGLHVDEVWLHYFSLGGNVDEFELDGYLHELIWLNAFDRNMISHAINELISDLPRPTAPYSDPTPNPTSNP